MKIRSFQIDGFGIWSGLTVEGLSDGLNVFYGPNEAGKTTLLQFLRSMLYGFSPRRRYLPPVHGGPAGGSVEVEGPNGRFQVSRRQAAGADGMAGEQLTLTAPDGTRQGEHYLPVLLYNVDEAIFNNVFAVGLREIQELNTLSDTEAAELLYRLTAGLDRVSLVEVMRALETSRNRILDADGKSCQMAQLLAEREKLGSEIESLAAQGRRFVHLAVERNELDAAVARCEEDVNRAERQLGLVELAVALRERWTQRAALDEQLASLGPAKSVPERAIERLDALHAKIKSHRGDIEQAKAQREILKREFADLDVQEALWRQMARIEALKEQEPWIAQLQSQVGELTADIASVESQVSEEGQRLGLKAGIADLPNLSSQTLRAVRPSAKLLGQCRRRRAEATRAAAAAQETVESLTRQIDSALAARGQRDLNSAMDRAGNVVLQLRRRLQIDQRLDQLARYETELEERSRQLVGRQLLPLWVLGGLGAVFAVGVVLILAGMFMPTSLTGTLGWSVALLGLAGSGSAVGGKLALERSNARQLDACQKQLGMLQLQVQQTKDDRDRLDGQLPAGSGTIASRLEAAEKDLAHWEELTPLDTRLSAARQEAAAAAKLLAQAKQETGAAARRWRQAVAATGLPEDMSPKQVRRLSQRCDRLAEMQRRRTQRREELSRRQQELNALTARIAQLAAEAGVSLSGTNPIEHLHQMSEALSRQEQAVARREAIRRQARKLRAAQARREEAISRLKHRRRSLFLEVGAADEREFRQQALRSARAEMLRRDRDALSREIQAALESHGSEDALRQQIEEAAQPLETRRDELRERLALLQQQLHARLETRGQLAEQIHALTADRQLAAKHLELATVEKRLADAIQRWQVLAVTHQVLQTIRTTYEQQRQPEALQEASGFLDRLTQGRYGRVWTPLGEKALRVDDADGNSLPVEVLSRGTREQLFLSLRLAIAGSYARRGATLPLVLDDVLVNFDADRAKAAATVLRDFADQGHQMLVFTCHEHILRLFKALRTPISQLPDHAAGVAGLIRLEHRGDERAKPAGEAAASRRKRAEKPAGRRRRELPPVENGASQDQAAHDECASDQSDWNDADSSRPSE